MIIGTAELRIEKDDLDDRWLRDEKERWKFCLCDVRKLWHLSRRRATYWLEAGTEPLRGGWKMEFRYLDGVKVPGDRYEFTLLINLSEIRKAAMELCKAMRAKGQDHFWVRLLYRED